jgi:hypothetical protein
MLQDCKIVQGILTDTVDLQDCKIVQGILTDTVDLLIKVACFVKKGNNIFNIE